MLLALAMSLAPSFGHCATLATCGPQKGYAYYELGLGVKGGTDGWTEDGITSGRTTLTQAENGDFDIIFTDATEGTYSSRADGATVILGRKTPNDVAFIVAYPGISVEVYQFTKARDGRSVMMMLQSKGNVLMSKAGLYVASCRFTGLFE